MRQFFCFIGSLPFLYVTEHGPHSPRRQNDSIDKIIEDFAFLGRLGRPLSLCHELGESAADLPDEKRTAENKVNGCASQVWLVSHHGEGADPVMNFEGDSDAHIVRGLVAIVLAACAGKRASEIAAMDVISTFDKIGLVENLSSQRANGLRSMGSAFRTKRAQRLNYMSGR